MRSSAGWSFDIKNVAFGGERCQLPALNASNFFLIGAQGKYWSGCSAAKFGNVVGFAIQDAPSDAGGYDRFRYLLHGSSDRLDEDCIRSLRFVLDNFQ